MGRRNKSYSKDLHQQAYERLNSMQAFGESRRAAKSEGADRDRVPIFTATGPSMPRPSIRAMPGLLLKYPMTG